MSLSEYMYTQKRLMDEQIHLWSASPLGKQLLAGKTPAGIEDFLDNFPLTSYADYADVLLAKRDDMLCSEPAIWIQTTWEGGLRPIKVAPYSRSMLNTYRHNLLATMMMATAKQRAILISAAATEYSMAARPFPMRPDLCPLFLRRTSISHGFRIPTQIPN